MLQLTYWFNFAKVFKYDVSSKKFVLVFQSLIENNESNISKNIFNMLIIFYKTSNLVTGRNTYSKLLIHYQVKYHRPYIIFLPKTGK